MTTLPPKFATDNILGILSLFERFGFPGHELVCLELIVDANIVMKDILWLIRKARSEGARTQLLEVLEAGTVICYAPEFLKVEMQKHIPCFAKRYNFDPIVAESLWSRFSHHITFVETGDPPTESDLQDPKDWPYLRVQELRNATIVSADSDIEAMGGLTSPITVIATLRDYTRETANEVHLRFFGYAGIAVPTALMFGLVKVISQYLGEHIPKPPPWVWWTSIGIIVAAIVYPPSRQWLRGQLGNVSESLAPKFGDLAEMIAPLIAEYERAKEEAEGHLDSAKRAGVSTYP